MRALLVLLLFISIQAQAKFDLKYGAQGRSYPSIGAGGMLESGYNFTLWGTAGKNPMYGLIRPYIKVNSSVVVNTVEGAIEFYPISFIGLIVGKEFNKSDIEFPFFDCINNTCEGNSASTFYTMRMALGFAGVLAVGELRREKTEFSETDKPFGDFFHGLYGAGAGDDFYERKFILGYQNDKFLIAAVSEFARYETTEQEKKNNLLIYRHFVDNGFYTVGAGQFETTDIEKKPIIIFQRVWEISKTLKLF